jgi:hypothetical protein
MRFIVYIAIIFIYACGSTDNYGEGSGLKEVYRYNAVDNAFLFIDHYDPVRLKNDSLLSPLEMQFDTANRTLIYFSDTLRIIDSIGYIVDGKSYFFGLYHFDNISSHDEECLIMLNGYNPFLIFNYPWYEYLFIVSDSTDKTIMKMVVADNRLIKKL